MLDAHPLSVLLAGFETNALTGQTLVVGHGWSMQSFVACPGARAGVSPVSATVRARSGPDAHPAGDPAANETCDQPQQWVGR